MKIIGNGRLWGKFAGISELKGKGKIKEKAKLILVHFETEEGKAVLLAEKKVFDKQLKDVNLGDSLFILYSVMSNDDDTIYVLEKAMGIR